MTWKEILKDDTQEMEREEQNARALTELVQHINNTIKLRKDDVKFVNSLKPQLQKFKKLLIDSEKRLKELRQPMPQPSWFRDEPSKIEELQTRSKEEQRLELDPIRGSKPRFSRAHPKFLRRE